MPATAPPAQTLPTQPHALLGTAEAASYLRVSIQTLNNWRCRGYGPKHITVGRIVRYRLRDIDAWLESRGAK